MAPLSKEQRARLQAARARQAATQSRIHATAAASVRAAFNVGEEKFVYEGNDGRWYQADLVAGVAGTPCLLHIERLGPALTIAEHLRDLARSKRAQSERPS